MHDANHGSYSNNQRLNHLMGLISSNGLGANAYFWKQNIISSTTRTPMWTALMTTSQKPDHPAMPSQKWVPAHQVQHLYLPFIYSLTSIFWIFFMDFTKYFSRKIYTTEAWKMSLQDHLIFWLTKVYYAAVFIVIPIMVWDGHTG